jgi:hypothetical protein
MKYLYTSLMIFQFTACAHDGSQLSTHTAATDHQADPNVQCKTEATMGSIVRKQHCTTPEQRDAERSQATDMMTSPALGGRRGGSN